MSGWLREHWSVRVAAGRRLAASRQDPFPEVCRRLARVGGDAVRPTSRLLPPHPARAAALARAGAAASLALARPFPDPSCRHELLRRLRPALVAPGGAPLWEEKGPPSSPRSSPWDAGGTPWTSLDSGTGQVRALSHHSSVHQQS